MSQDIKDRHKRFLRAVQTENFFFAIDKEAPFSIKKNWKQLIKQLTRKRKYEGPKETRG